MAVLSCWIAEILSVSRWLDCVKSANYYLPRGKKGTKLLKIIFSPKARKTQRRLLRQFAIAHFLRNDKIVWKLRIFICHKERKARSFWKLEMLDLKPETWNQQPVTFKLATFSPDSSGNPAGLKAPFSWLFGATKEATKKT